MYIISLLIFPDFIIVIVFFIKGRLSVLEFFIIKFSQPLAAFAWLNFFLYIRIMFSYTLCLILFLNIRAPLSRPF